MDASTQSDSSTPSTRALSTKRWTFVDARWTFKTASVARVGNRIRF
jgi:hypothetical protein